jgi:type IV secretory pathway VirB2 component (pilin)
VIRQKRDLPSARHPCWYGFHTSTLADKQMKQTPKINWLLALSLLAALVMPYLAFAQAGSPFETGATNLVTSITTLATPIAVLLVMALGIAAAAGRISWGWPLGVIVGIGLVFAAQPIVTWVRGLFGA